MYEPVSKKKAKERIPQPLVLQTFRFARTISFGPEFSTQLQGNLKMSFLLLKVTCPAKIVCVTKGRKVKAASLPNTKIPTQV